MTGPVSGRGPGLPPLPHAWVRGLMSRTAKDPQTESMPAHKGNAGVHLPWRDWLQSPGAQALTRGEAGPQENLTALHSPRPAPDVLFSTLPICFLCPRRGDLKGSCLPAGPCPSEMATAAACGQENTSQSQ